MNKSLRNILLAGLTIGIVSTPFIFNNRDYQKEAAYHAFENFNSVEGRYKTEILTDSTYRVFNEKDTVEYGFNLQIYEEKDGNKVYEFCSKDDPFNILPVKIEVSKEDNPKILTH